MGVVWARLRGLGHHEGTKTTKTHEGQQAGEYLGEGARARADAHRLDLLVENLVIVEGKSVEALEPIHDAQLLTYLRLSQRWLGLLLNFNATLLRRGLRRMLNG
jgi:GxxExxY protein